MPWYDGPSLLHHLEHVHIASDRNLIDVRFPVQYVIRPHQATDPELHDYRGYAGQVAGGVLKPGDEVMHLPSGLTTTISGSTRPAGPVRGGVPADVGDAAARRRPGRLPRRHVLPPAQPAPGRPGREAMVCWMTDARPLAVGSRLVVKHTTRTVKAIVRDLHYRIDVNTLHRDETASQLA
jgi:bifunctional enzyme CysN/CysC